MATGELDRLRTALADHYVVEREIGRGGMARVYLALDRQHGRQVAVKLLAPEVATLLGPERFLREIRIEASLQHPHILPLYGSGSAQGLLYYVMPYVEGESLRQRIRRETQLPIGDALRITREVAHALDYAHAQGVVHRDIKPGNILLAGYPPRDGTSQAWHALVADFGIARVVSLGGDDVLTATGIAVGTPEYMSPEQASADRSVDRRTDVYALGCVLYEMLAGSPPFSGRTVQWVIARHRQDPVPSIRQVRDTVPAHVEAAVVRALAKVPADRFASAREFADALDAAPHAPVPAGARRLRPGWRRLWPWAAAPLAAAAVLSVLLLRPGRGPDAVSAATRPSWILVSDLEGPPGDRTLAAAVRELVTAELDHSRAVVPMPRQQLEAVMRDAGLADTTALTGTLARELAVRGAVRAILGGSVLPVGRDRYSVVLRVVEPDSGATLVTATRVADDRNLVPVVQDAAREIREGLGERRAALRASAPLVKVATPSFAAYRKFVEAVELSDRGEPAASNRLLREAIALDTGFASAWATLATNYLTLRKLDSAGLAVAQALRRPDRLSDPQRYRLEADAAYALRYDIPAAVRAYDLVLGSSPNSISGVNNRATFLYALGRYQDALAGFARAEALEPFGPEGARIEIFNQAVTLLALGRFADAAAKANQLRGLFADYAAELLATARGRWSIADSIASKGLADPGTPGYLRLPNVTIAAGAEAAQGNPAAADRRLRVAAAGADAAERPWFANAVLLLAAAAGHSPGAVPDWLRADTASGALVAGGIWAAMAGDTALARRQLSALNQRPAVRLRHLGYGPTLLSAYLLAAEGRWTDVARRLEAAARAGERDGGDLDQVSGAAVRWLVAEAYERLGKPDSAAAMYELIVDPSGVPFGHVPLRGLTYPFASRRLASLRARTDRPD